MIVEYFQAVISDSGKQHGDSSPDHINKKTSTVSFALGKGQWKFFLPIILIGFQDRFLLFLRGSRISKNVFILVSVLLVFCHHRFLQHRQDIGFYIQTPDLVGFSIGYIRS